MNSVVEAVRKKYPGSYTNLSDDELTVAIGKRYTNYLDRADFAADFKRLTEVAPPAPPPKEEGLLGKITGGLSTYGEAMAKQHLPQAGVPAVTVPEFGEEGSFTRGVSKGVKSLVEGATTPEMIAASGLIAAPVVGKVIAGGMIAAGAYETGKLASESVLEGSPEKAGEAAVIGTATGLGLLGVAKHAPASAEAAKVTVTELVPESRRLAGTGIRMPEYQEGPIGPEPRSVAPESRQLPGPRTLMPEYQEGVIGPEPRTVAPESRQLPAPRTPLPEASESTLNAPKEIITHGTEPGEVITRISLPVEPETAKAARRIWSKPIDVEAQVTGIDALRQLVSLTEEKKTPGKPYEPPTVNVDLRQLEKMLKKNTVKTVESWADEVINNKLKDVSANPFFDPEFLAAAATKAAILVRKGVTKFEDFSDAMRKQFGAGIEERLPALFEQASKKEKPTAPMPREETSYSISDVWRRNTSRYLDTGYDKATLGETETVKLSDIEPSQEHGSTRPELVKAFREGKSMTPVVLERNADGSIRIVDGSYRVNSAEEAGVSEIPAKFIKYEDGLTREAAEEALLKAEAQPAPFTAASLATPASQTLGISPTTPRNTFQKLASSFQKYFTVKGHAPQEVHDLVNRMEGAKTASDASLRYMERKLMGALTEQYGLNPVEVLGGGSRRIPPRDVQLMDDYIKGRVPNPAVIPPKVRGVLDAMRAEIDGWSNKVMAKLTAQRNRLPAGSAEWQNLDNLINKIRDNMDVYVHRSYKFFDTDAKAPDWYAELPSGIQAAAEDLIMSRNPGMPRPEAQSRLLDWLSDLRGSDGFGSAKLGAKDLSTFMRRGVIDPEFRAVLGEYRNPMVNYAKSVAKMADWVAKQTFLEDVRRVGMGTFLFEKGANPPGFNAEIAAKGSDTMSPLNGLRTTQEIADVFKQMDETGSHNALARVYLTLNAWSKFAATGLSVMTQARNLLSRPLMAGMAGHWNVTKLPRSVRAVFEDFAGNNAKWQGYLKEAYDLGVIGDSARAGELQAIVKDAALQDVHPADLYSWSLARAAKKLGYKVPAEIYRLSDDLGNLFGWENEKLNQRAIHPGWSEAEVKAEAAKVTRDLYPVYSETPEAVKGFRKTAILGPFVTFPYQVFRTTWNALGRSMHEIRSANPVERTVGYKRLASQAATLTAAYGLQELGKKLVGVNTQQADDFRRAQPSWAKNSKWLFTDKNPETGELTAVNLSYLDPYSYITDPAVAVAESLRSDRSPFEVFVETSKETLRPWISEQMLAKSIIEARNGKTDNGREIFNPTDPPFEVFKKQLRHVLRPLEPGTLQRVERRILPAIRDEQPVYGRKLDPKEEIARELSGIAVEKVNFGNWLANQSRKFVDADKASEDVFHKTVSQTQTTTSEDLLAAYKESDRRRFELWKEMRGDFMAALRNGVSPDKAIQMMVARGVSKRDAGLISSGVYIPTPVSKQTVARAIERKRELPFDTISNYIAEQVNKPLD